MRYVSFLSCFSDSCSSLPHLILFRSCSFVFLYSLDGFFFSAACFVSSSSFVPHPAFSFSGCSSHPGSIPGSLLSPHFSVSSATLQTQKESGDKWYQFFVLSDSVFLLLSSIPVEENKSHPVFIVQQLASIYFVLILRSFNSEVGGELPKKGREGRQVAC